MYHINFTKKTTNDTIVQKKEQSCREEMNRNKITMNQGFASATQHLCEEVTCSWGKSQLRLEGRVPTANTEPRTVSIPTDQTGKVLNVISRRILPQ